MAQIHGEARIETDPKTKVCIESHSSLCQSIIWKWLSRYYEQMAANAWSSNQVPMFISSNARLCRDYANLVYSYLLDYYIQNPQSTKTTYIIEVGAGHGRFSFLFLRKLLALLPVMKAHRIFPAKPFVFVFTDIAEGNIEACRQHPRMAEFIKDGWLDFAVFDAEDPPEKVYLVEQRSFIPPASPLIIISNYVMDSLKTDAIRIVPKKFLVNESSTDAVIYIAKLSVYSDREEVDPEDPSILGRATFGWDWRPVKFENTLSHLAPEAEKIDLVENAFILGQSFGSDKCRNHCSDGCEEGCLDNDCVDQIIATTISETRELESLRESAAALDQYVEAPEWMNDERMIALLKHYIKQSLRIGCPMTITIPIGAISVLQYFIEMSNNQLLAIIGDKGYASPINLLGLRNPHIAIHGTISFGCNFNVLDKFTDVVNGFHFNTKYKGSFHISCFCFNHNPEHQFLHLGAQMLQRWQDIMPESLISIMHEAAELELSKGVSLRHMNAIIRLSCHDPDAFNQFAKSRMVNCQPPEMSPLYETDMLDDLHEVYMNWFKLKDDDDLLEAIAHICLKLGRTAEAVFYLKEFEKWCPDLVSAGTLTNLAGCFRSMRNLQLAQEVIDKCLSRWPGFKPAMTLQAHLNMSKRKRRIAIVGCGSFASDLSHFLIRDERLEIVAVFAFNQKSAQDFLFTHQIHNAKIVDAKGLTQDISENSDITEIVLDLDMSLWSTFLPKFWANGKNIVCEKTVGISSKELQSLIDHFNEFNVKRSLKGLPSITWHVTNRESSDGYIGPHLVSVCGKSVRAGTVGTRVMSREVSSNQNGRESELLDMTCSIGIAVALKRDLVRSLNICRKITASDVKFVSCHLCKDFEAHPIALNGWATMRNISSGEEYPLTFHVGLVNHGIHGFSSTFVGSDGQAEIKCSTCCKTQVHILICGDRLEISGFIPVYDDGESKESYVFSITRYSEYFLTWHICDRVEGDKKYESYIDRAAPDFDRRYQSLCRQVDRMLFDM